MNHFVELTADAPWTERPDVGADLLEGPGERLDVGVGKVAGEVLLDPVPVMAAGRSIVSRPSSVRTTRIERRSFSGRTRRTRPASSIRSTTRVKPLLL